MGLVAKLRAERLALVKNRAAVGSIDAFHHFDGGGLAGAIGPEQTETDTPPDLETDISHRLDRAE